MGIGKNTSFAAIAIELVKMSKPGPRIDDRPGRNGWDIF
jgi:hypothetical protein